MTLLSEVSIDSHLAEAINDWFTAEELVELLDIETLELIPRLEDIIIDKLPLILDEMRWTTDEEQ